MEKQKLLFLRSCEGLIDSAWDVEESCTEKVIFKLSTYSLSRMTGFHHKRSGKKEHSKQREQHVQRQSLVHLSSDMQF